MKAGSKVVWSVAIAGVLGFASNGLAQVSMTLTTPTGYSASYPNDVFAGVYVDPYVATVNGVANVPVICDDFLDDTAVGATWQATVLNGSTQFSQSRMYAFAGATQAQYEQVAWLAEQLMTYTGTSSAAQTERDYISFALWSIFEPTAVSTWLNNSILLYGVTTSDITAINGWVTAAQANATAADLSNITIYSPCVGSKSCSGPKNSVPAQEFIVVSPDAPAIETLGLNLLALGALVFLARKRIMVWAR